jgi:GT2 family glycosyltransferase
MSRILVTIPTHKRSVWCAALLRQIKELSGNHQITVAVFHDLCDSDYTDVVNICKENNWYYFKSKENLGKYRFWELNNLMYAFADGVQFDYYIQLPDDVILVDNFFDRVLSLIFNKKVCINFFTANIYLKTYATCEVLKIDGVDVWQNGWIDSAFATTKHIMQGFRIDMPQATKTRRANSGTGCGAEQSKVYFKKSGIKSFQTVYALCEHIGNNSTVMHDNERGLKMYAENRAELLKFNLTPEDRKYIELIKPKFGIMEAKKTTVAIVGSAAYLKGKKLGAEIDSNDIVVRINQNSLIIKEHAEDIGMKTSVCYLSSTTFNTLKDKLPFPKSAVIRKKNGGLQNMKGLKNYCMNTGFIAVIEYAMKGYDVTVYGMDFYAGANNGKIIKKPLNCGIENPIRVDKSLIHLSGYTEAIGDYRDYFEMQHVGGMEDLLAMLEFQQKYNIKFDKYMQQTIIDNIKTDIHEVDVHIATLYRDCYVKNTIESLLNCPELCTISVVCNNWTDEQFKELSNHFCNKIKVFLYRSDNKKGCSEKFKYFGATSSKYICNCDDDLIYPNDFLTRLIEVAKNNVVAGIHGRTLLDRKIDNYYKEKKAVYHSMRDVAENTEVEIIGTGGTLFERSLISDICNLYDYVKFPNMSDIYFSYLAKIRGVKMIAVKHSKDWIKHKEMKPTDDYIFDQYKDNCYEQTNFVNRFFKGFE